MTPHIFSLYCICQVISPPLLHLVHQPHVLLMKHESPSGLSNLYKITLLVSYRADTRTPDCFYLLHWVLKLDGKGTHFLHGETEVRKYSRGSWIV